MNSAMELEWPGWDEAAAADGVRLRTAGSGRPLIVVPGMEGDGTSCMQTVLPVWRALQDNRPTQLILVDYSAERHASLSGLEATMVALLRGVVREPAAVWGQSFGCLPAAAIAAQINAPFLVLVSPFCSLPVSRTFAAGLLKWTPRAVYRPTAKPVGQWVFGPLGRQRHHAFFRTLQDADPRDVARRTGWLRGQDFRSRFEQGPASVGTWFGIRDRLVDLRGQLEVFSLLNQADGFPRFIPGGGHILFPEVSIAFAQKQILSWLRSWG